MKKSMQLISAMALVANLTGIDASAQSLSGDAAAQGAVTKYPRFHTANSGAGVALGGQTGDQGGSADVDRPDMDLSGDAAMRRAVPMYPRFHDANSGAGVSLGNQIVDPQNGGVTSGNLGGDLVGDITGDLSDDIIMPGAPFVVFAGDGPDNPLLLIDAGIVPTAGIRVLQLAPSLPGEGHDQVRDINVYFRSDDIIVCFQGRDDMPSVDQVALVGPGSAGLASGQGATLALGSQSLTMSGAMTGSSDGDSTDDRDQDRRRDQDGGAMGTSASVGQQGSL